MLLVGLGVAAVAWASGWPPFAQRDYIEVARGGIAERLTSGAASVLANDFDIENDRLTAVLVDDVEHGTLEFRSDGTFKYQHDGSKGDSDEFRYRAFDGTSYSRRTRVSIEIQEAPNQPPYVIGEVPDQQAVVGVEFRLELAGYFADPDEGDELRFIAGGLPSSNSLRIDPLTGVLSGTPIDGAEQAIQCRDHGGRQLRCVRAPDVQPFD